MLNVQIKCDIKTYVVVCNCTHFSVRSIVNIPTVIDIIISQIIY